MPRKVTQHAVAGRRELLPAPHPLEQALAQRGFKLLDHLGGGRLRHAQLGRGLAQRAVLTDGEDQRDLAHAQAVEQLGIDGSGAGCSGHGGAFQVLISIDHHRLSNNQEFSIYVKCHVYHLPSSFHFASPFPQQ
jgi:hypothetical protein